MCATLSGHCNNRCTSGFPTQAARNSLAAHAWAWPLHMRLRSTLDNLTLTLHHHCPTMHTAHQHSWQLQMA
jgi:hypothetical protein